MRRKNLVVLKYGYELNGIISQLTFDKFFGKSHLNTVNNRESEDVTNSLQDTANISFPSFVLFCSIAFHINIYDNAASSFFLELSCWYQLLLRVA